MDAIVEVREEDVERGIKQENFGRGGRERGGGGMERKREREREREGEEREEGGGSILNHDLSPSTTSTQGPNFEFSTETHQELLYNKEKLLSNGDKWEKELAANIEADFLYR